MEAIDWSQDRTNSISSTSGRLVVDGERAIQVQPDAASKTQIAALMDLIDLHLSQVDPGSRVDPERVTLRVPHLAEEARGALGTLLGALIAPVRVQILEYDGQEKWQRADVGWDIATVSEYRRWPDLLGRARPVPPLVTAIASAVDSVSLRAYPMLSTTGGWSLRVEGLEVGRVDANTVTLGVGKDGKHGDQSAQRRAWVDATGRHDKVTTSDAQEAASLIASFADSWVASGSSDVQDEHALESRILRGAVPITVRGIRLSLIQPDPIVNWGSQFPTKWGPSGKARYLDALMRDGSTPWAIEMKVQGGGGVGRYYRHAVAQAVLYREFIRRATPLHPWFDSRGLEAARCEAAVVVPRITNSRQSHWSDRVARVCHAFGVEYVEVDPDHARRH